jgi:hypothetical protein
MRTGIKKDGRPWKVRRSGLVKEPGVTEKYVASIISFYHASKYDELVLAVRIQPYTSRIRGTYTPYANPYLCFEKDTVGVVTKYILFDWFTAMVKPVSHHTDPTLGAAIVLPGHNGPSLEHH